MSSNQTKPTTIILIILGILTFCCCCSLVVAGTAALFLRNIDFDRALPTVSVEIQDRPSPDAPDRDHELFPPKPTPEGGMSSPEVNPGRFEQAEDTLETLQNLMVPINDPIDLASRLGGKGEVPKQLIDPDAPYALGARKTFWVTNVDTNENFQIEASLRYLGENIYFWIEDGVNYKESELKSVADFFDKETIPTNREFFGSEWNPGVDGDPRLYVLYAGNLGYNLAGYFSSADELHPDAHPYSNAHEMFLINSDNVRLSEDYLRGTMAHEFQHMIHWYQDKNEETWMNEGFSMLAEHVNELDAGGFDWEFALEPDLQLTDWGGDVGLNGPHYGSAYLFMVYFLDRFGEDASKALVAEAENGMVSISKVMQELVIINPDTGKPYTGEEVFRDWTIANLVQDASLAGKRYGYQSYNPPSFNVQNAMSCEQAEFSASVYQFGTQYIELDCLNGKTIDFEGSELVRLLPVPEIPSGEYFFWSNAADESNPRLTQTFDLSQESGKISLDFKVWYELEDDYDFAYISASTDGEYWQILKSQTCTTANISGNSYGCGWNGESNGWIDESVDLSAYAGKHVILRFDYVTDAAVNLNGLAIDDLRIDAIGYATDLESDNGGWRAEGFAQVTNYLPQEFAVSVIQEGRNTSVQQYLAGSDGKLSFPLEFTPGTQKVYLAISGLTPYTREKGSFSISIR